MSRLLRTAVKVVNRNTCHVQILPRRGCSTKEDSTVKDVPGLSKKVVDVPCECVGFPGASKEAVYKNPEYFCYNNISYFEAEVEMLKYRLPQPSNKTKK